MALGDGSCMRRFAHVQDMDQATTTFVFTFSMGLRLQSQAALGLAVSRLIEERVGLAEGMADVRKRLLIIGKPLIAPLRCVAQGRMFQVPRRQAQPHDCVSVPCLTALLPHVVD